MSEFLALGRHMTTAQRRARERIITLLLPALEAGADPRNVLITIMASSYVDGRVAAMLAHGPELGRPKPRITRKEAREWRDAAQQRGLFVADRLQHLLEQRDVSQAQFRQYSLSSAEMTTWAGQDDEADELAKIAEVEWKSWVRAWPREEHRDHHDELEGTTIPIEESFTLPGGPNAGSKVYGPRDWQSVPDPAEHLHCGHALRFSRGRGTGTVYDPPTASRVWARRQEP